MTKTEHKGDCVWCPSRREVLAGGRRRVWCGSEERDGCISSPQRVTAQGVCGRRWGIPCAPHRFRPSLCPALPGGHQPVSSILRASFCLRGVAQTCPQLSVMDGVCGRRKSGRLAGHNHHQQQQLGCVFLGDQCV